MTNPAQHHRPASKKQLTLLRILAADRGQSFAYPQTTAEASQEIRRLMRESRVPRADRSREDKIVREAIAGSGDDARVRGDELAGWGSTAGWSREVEDDGEGRDRR